MPTDPAQYLEFTYTKSFVASAKGLFSEQDLRDLELQLIEDPEAGTIERGTGGVRKVRVALEGRGKSGGARVVYFYIKSKGRIYLLLAYPKNEKDALTTAERNALKGIAGLIEGE